jgi:hypothetical protein
VDGTPSFGPFPLCGSGGIRELHLKSSCRRLGVVRQSGETGCISYPVLGRRSFSSRFSYSLSGQAIEN